jgi:signal peptidase I
MGSNFIRFIVFTALVLGVIVGALRLTCLRWWQVPEDDPDLAASVAPTLRAGDWIILWRGTTPGFGDLVLCPDPEEPEEVVIGRVAAEAGDDLVVGDDGSLRVNGVRIRPESKCNVPTFTVQHPRNGDDIELRCDVESLGGHYHQRALVPQKAPLRPVGVKRHVGAGTAFLISDNRYLPFDSRDFGPVPQASCRETVIFRLVSRLGFAHVESRLSWIQ